MLLSDSAHPIIHLQEEAGVPILANLKYFFAGQNPTFCRTFLVFAGHPQSFLNIPQKIIGPTPQTHSFYIKMQETNFA